MISTPTASRDSRALLDPPTEERPGRSGASTIASYHLVGRGLLRTAMCEARREAAAAAVEVFREAIEVVPTDPSLHNSLGASLLTLARFETHARAVAMLRQATQEFQTTSAMAVSQQASGAARLRYSVNLATTQWMHGERTGDQALINSAVDTLRSVLTGLSSSSSPHWAHTQDNLGSALMAQGNTATAIVAFKAALGGQQSAEERARSLNNLGTAYAQEGSYAKSCNCFRESLLLLSQEQSPLTWGLVQHNLAGALLQTALSCNQPEREGETLRASVNAFEAALDARLRARTPLDWAVTTVNMAGALLSLGTHLCAVNNPPADQSGLSHIRRAIGLYHDALPELSDSDLRKTVSNLLVALQILGKLSADKATLEEIQQSRMNLLKLTRRRGLGAITNEADGSTENATLVQPPRPAGRPWPKEVYSQAHRSRKENIVQFLTRVWLPLIATGAVDMRTLRERDPSAAKAIDNFQRSTDPVTGLRRRLPVELDIPTKREANDRLAANLPSSGDRPARLDWALRARARRTKQKD